MWLVVDAQRSANKSLIVSLLVVVGVLEWRRYSPVRLATLGVTKELMLRDMY